jgi:GNAT superfamily N-acetyltransferase
MLITDALARRLEAAEAVDAADCAEAASVVDAGSSPALEAMGGGILTFCGAISPLNHALGLAMHGPMTDAELDAIEAFFRSRGAPVVVDVCPHADPSLREMLSARDYRVSEMNNVLVRALRAGETWPQDIRVERAADEDLYARTVGTGFFGREEITVEEYKIGQILFHMKSGVPLLAWSGDVEAGACGFSARNGVASFFGDATLTRFRRRGVHAAMIAERLRLALDAGCDLATAGTHPGSTSQRNYQRLGFDVAYTRVTMVSP